MVLPLRHSTLFSDVALNIGSKYTKPLQNGPLFKDFWLLWAEMSKCDIGMWGVCLSAARCM
jgi:hypothetical protein